MRLIWFLIELTTHVYYIFMENDLFCNGKTQPQTPAQWHTPIHESGTRRYFQQCDQNIVTEDAMFTNSLHARLTGYSAILT